MVQKRYIKCTVVVHFLRARRRCAGYCLTCPLFFAIKGPLCGLFSFLA
ncbi:hypothetical protein [Klebsiella pneumoniae IS46]|nr:hypothetical protein [Klebsiella pneumoniae IS46]